MKLVLPLPPSVNAYRKYRVRTTFKNRRLIHTVQTYKSTETKQYESIAGKIVREAMKEYEWTTPPKEAFIIAHTTFYFARINQDDNNYYKVPLDVLEGAGAILNDCKVMVRTEDILIDSENPRMEIELKVSEKMGVFKNSEEFERFKEKNCSQCSRLNRNCRLLKDFLENKKYSQIAHNICLKSSKLHKVSEKQT